MIRCYSSLLATIFCLALLKPGFAEEKNALDSPTAAKESIRLTPRWSPGEVYRVKASVEAGGDLVLDDKAPDRKTPMSVSAKFEFDERLVGYTESESTQPKKETGADTESQAGFAARSLRHYALAEAEIKIAKGGVKRLLPIESKILCVEAQGGKLQLFSPKGPITRDSLDLVTLAGDPLILDRLLPGKSVAAGESWANDAKAIQSLLQLEAISVCEVKSTFLGVENQFAKIQLNGHVEGAVDGVATEIEVKASYLYSIKLGRITRFNLAQQEKRTPGPIGPGLDVVAKLQLTMEPIESSPRLTDDLVVELPDAIDAMLPLRFIHEKSGIEFMHSRNWYVTSEQADNIVLRNLEGGELISQCRINLLPKLPAPSSLSLKGFQEEVIEALGKRAERIASANEWDSTSGMKCMCVVAVGKISDVMMEWRYFNIMNENGERIGLTITLEQGLVERFDDAEAELVESLLIPSKTNSAKAEGKKEVKK